MTAPRPYSEEPRWKEIASVMFIGGALTVMVGGLVGHRPAEVAGSFLITSGALIRILTAIVWLK